jgi:hypothetical protein
MLVVFYMRVAALTGRRGRVERGELIRRDASDINLS